MVGGLKLRPHRVTSTVLGIELSRMWKVLRAHFPSLEAVSMNNYSSGVPLELHKEISRELFSVSPRPRRLSACRGYALTLWDDDSWTEVIKKGRDAGQYPPSIVKEAARIIDIWNPRPFPSWMTCVPSDTLSCALTEFSKSVADFLGIRFNEIIAKRRQNFPQKSMNSTTERCSNLDGAFHINGSPMEGPVFLIDDVFDSGWAMTVVTALLREFGFKSPIYPFALGKTQE